MISAETRRGGASIAAIETQKDLIAFIDIHFTPQIHLRYPRTLERTFRLCPHRAQSGDFLRFLGRSLLIAAEFGWPEAGVMPKWPNPNLMLKTSSTPDTFSFWLVSWQKKLSASPKKD